MLTFWTDATSDVFLDIVVDSLAGLEPRAPVRRVSFETGVPLLPQVDEVVVAMGAPAVETLQKIGAVPKNRSLTSLRETAVAFKVMGVAEGGAEMLEGYGHWMFSYSPNAAFVEADKRSQIAWDARLAHRFYSTHSLEPPLGTYAYTDTLEYVIQYVEEKFAETGKAVSVALDLETMGLIPWYDDKKIVTIQVSVEPEVADVVYLLDDIWNDPARWHKLMAQVRWLLNSPKVALCGANLKFDIIWIWVKWGLRPTNFKMDTLLVGSLLDENRSNSLKQHAKEHTAMGGYELPLEKWFKENKLDKGQMDKVPKDQLLYYAGPDTDATIRVSIHQRKQLQQEKRLQRFYVKLLHPAARAFEAVEHRGLVADLDEFAKLDKEISANIKDLEAQCIAMMPVRLRNKYAGTGDMLRAAVLKDFFFSDMGMNLKPILFTEKTGAIKTDKGHFMLFRDHPEAGPFIKLYTELNSAKKMLSTYVHGFLNHLRPDGRFHPTYMLYNGSAFEGKDDDGGTDTGRTSAVDPAVQTIPKHTKWAKRLRKAYPAPPGYRFFQADFSQGELRLAADAAEEPNMIEAYQAGKDLHCVTGAQLAGLEFDEFMAHDIAKNMQTTPAAIMAAELFAKFRQRAKPANFGLLYGMQAEGFRVFALMASDGKMDLTLEEATQVRDAFFSLYSRLLEWHGESIAFAKEYGYIENPLGRIAHLPLIKSKVWKVSSKQERKAINSPIQSTLSDLCSWSIAFLEERYADDGLWIAGMTHDSIYGYYPEDKQYLLGEVKGTMESLPYREVFDWHPVLDFPVDIEEGLNMAELEKFKFAA